MPTGINGLKLTRYGNVAEQVQKIVKNLLWVTDGYYAKMYPSTIRHSTLLAQKIVRKNSWWIFFAHNSCYRISNNSRKGGFCLKPILSKSMHCVKNWKCSIYIFWVDKKVPTDAFLICYSVERHESTEQKQAWRFFVLR